ncbi:DUF2510 domain-containing protein [Microbacterium saperdae]|uniref:Uncharacterized protein DUF2510 n=1 Tax=Microbacterium saperdae TaxID=69368 RepID=A0A543BB80_9MICO|nr:DUF2510 domain-containing protein [Microbacterium saperdae]TQL82100.1 uncharacterized protein DUF2510 [Microbacterium saperdae]GGM37201.1 hypothetical protein GCM10010489_05200 [Microbacterium saperdae]
MTTPNETPAGWYDDGSGRQRWWDGQQWGVFADEARVPAVATAPAPLATGATGPKKLNVLALVAAIVAVVGFIFACIPGALILGWILLPIAFILSIVSLFLKGDKKWLGIVGLILSIVGTIVGVFVFLGVVATSFDDAFGGGDTTVTQLDDAEDDDAPADDEPADAEQGTRENPIAIGAEISNSEWVVVVNSVNPDGNAIVSDANQFNEVAPSGSHYEIVNYTITYKGADSASSSEVTVDVVTSAGNVVNSFDSMVVLSDEFGFEELFAGAAVTGSQAFLVPDGETILVRVSPGYFADEVFVKP